MATHSNGDVAARVILRFAELMESMRLIKLILTKFPAGELRATVADAPENALGVGWVEGWRGEIVVAPQIRCQPAPCRHAAGDRAGFAAHGNSAQTHL